MLRSGNAVLSHCGLIPFKAVYEKRRGLLRSIVRKENLIDALSAAFCNFGLSYKGEL